MCIFMGYYVYLMNILIIYSSKPISSALYLCNCFVHSLHLDFIPPYVLLHVVLNTLRRVASLGFGGFHMFLMCFMNLTIS